MATYEELMEKDEQYFAEAGRISYYSLLIDHADQATLVDIKGKEYIDLLSSASATNTGHSPKKVTDAIKNQADKMLHYTPAYMYHEPAIKLAEKLCEITPGDFEKKATFGLSGSDACDGVMKYARAYTGRSNIVTFQNAYHGSTYGALSMSALNNNMRAKMGPNVPNVEHIPFPDNYRGMYGKAQPNSIEEYLAPFKQMMETYLPSEEIACVVVETIQGDGGLLEPVPGYFKALYELCHEHGILFAVDDVQQGLGRTGTWCSTEHFNVEADLVVYGKSLASGMPLSAIVGRKEIMDSLEAPAHIFTTAANPVCCAASLATLDMIEEDNLLQESTRKGEIAQERMQKWENDYAFIGDVRGFGLSIGIDIVTDKKTQNKG
ncbi:aminotransferase [Tetragenococcus muriaticus PMC-11-5]|uniref:Aminotransferase n=1 Tax=Tetragenococcus muriaticus PMC-11-5 TaxID=1302649 RepID=A0A091CA44_9ENTE|nr:aspartate aminotransferase family protein [Tetragenococcus muriaticus]KFN93810.1 aminotransferase [Tetragenococcus muriaticus PMC-11-5]